MADETKNTDETKTAKTAKSEDRNPIEVANDLGYFGTKVDPEPNERYTVAGVIKAAEAAAKQE